MIEKEEREVNIGFLFHALLHRAWVILLSVLLGAAMLFCYAKFFVTPTYNSTAKLYVNNRMDNDGNNEGYISGTEISASKDLVNTYIAILKTPDTLELVAQRAGLNIGYGSLISMISAGSVNETEVFYITVSASSPDDAKLIAEEITNVLPEKISEIIKGSSVKVVEKPRLPTSKSSPSISKYVTIGGVMGLLLSSALIILLELIDNKINDSSYPSSTYGVKTLASIPDFEIDAEDEYAYGAASRKKGKFRFFKHKRRKYRNIQNAFIPCDKLPFRVSEAYKMLRTSLLNMRGDRAVCDVIGISSSCSSEGKSTLAIYLSHAFAMQNKRVLLIEADLRKPVIAKRLELSPAHGLSDILSGKCAPELQTSPYFENWKIICGGRTENNPSELLSSHAMDVLLSDLRKEFDLIIVDLPPINDVTDSIAISAYLDGIIFAVRENSTTKMELATAMNHLAFSRTELLGFVVTNSSIDGKYSKYGRYGRKSYYYR